MNDKIPVKSLNASPLYFYGFGYLKQELNKKRTNTIYGLRKYCQSVWNTITPADITRAFDSWKFRCRLINKKSGNHIEQTKLIYRRKFSFIQYNKCSLLMY